MAAPMKSTRCGKLVFEKSSFLSKNSRHEAVVNESSLNHAISLTIPTITKICESIAEEVNSQHVFLVKDVPLSLLIEYDFIEAFVRRGSLYMLSQNTRIDQDLCVALVPNGRLILHVDKDTYEELGLDGKPSVFNSKGSTKYVIEINILAENFTSEKKFYERVKWCFSNRLDLKLSFLVTWFPLEPTLCPSSINNFFTSNDICSKHCHFKPRQWFKPKGKIPVIKPEDYEGGTEFANYTEVFEWLGAEACEIDSESGAPDDFLNTFCCPEPSIAVDEVTNCLLSGFITRETIHSTIERLRGFLKRPNGCPWVAVTVHGFQDSPVSSRSWEHGFNKSGSHSYTYLIFRNEDYWLYTARGSHDVIP